MADLKEQLRAKGIENPQKAVVTPPTVAGSQKLKTSKLNVDFMGTLGAAIGGRKAPTPGLSARSEAEAVVPKPTSIVARPNLANLFGGGVPKLKSAKSDALSQPATGVETPIQSTAKAPTAVALDKASLDALRSNLGTKIRKSYTPEELLASQQRNARAKAEAIKIRQDNGGGKADEQPHKPK